jgi:type VI protein secretion system component VasK
MDVWLGKIALVVVLIYLASSFLAALRMYFVHGHYVHIELAGKKWRSFGSWAPRQYKRLTVLRSIAFVMVLLWIVGVCVVVYQGK